VTNEGSASDKQRKLSAVRQDETVDRARVELDSVSVQLMEGVLEREISSARSTRFAAATRVARASTA
jgi:hypothetical protein